MSINSHHSWHVNSFIGSHSAGNAHRVEIYRNQWPKEPVGHEGSIAVELLITDSARFDVAARFSINGQPIQRCGSGTVAAAYVLLQQMGLTDVTLQTSCEHLKLLNENGRFGYITQGLALSRSSPTPLARACAGQPGFDFTTQELLECYLAGQEQDYIVAVLANEAQVAQFQPDLTALIEDCPRAMIITAPSSSPDLDFVLRYFAPQYGVPEDSATGSANAVLAPYWAQRLGKNDLRSRQLSEKGGQFYLSVLTEQPPTDLLDPLRVSVFGQAAQR